MTSVCFGLQSNALCSARTNTCEGHFLLIALTLVGTLKQLKSCTISREKGAVDEGRAAVGSVHAAMTRPVRLEALVAQKRAHRSGSVLHATARPPHPPTPSPL